MTYPRRPAVALIYLALFLGLSACAAGPRKPVPLPEFDTPEDAETAAGVQAEVAAIDPGPSEAVLWERHRSAVTALAAWQTRGKVAYRLGDEGGSANLIWEQIGEQSELSLSGPLGAGSMRVRNEGELINVRRDGIERRYPADGAPWLPNGQLLPIPMASIPYWLRGLPDPGRPLDLLETGAGVARHIRQDGWSITLDEYHESFETPLPKRVRIEAPDTELKLRTYLRQWTIE